jgi:hypothetical protein
LYIHFDEEICPHFFYLWDVARVLLRKQLCAKEVMTFFHIQEKETQKNIHKIICDKVARIRRSHTHLTCLTIKKQQYIIEISVVIVSELGYLTFLHVWHKNSWLLPHLGFFLSWLLHGQQQHSEAIHLAKAQQQMARHAWVDSIWAPSQPLYIWRSHPLCRVRHLVLPQADGEPP